MIKVLFIASGNSKFGASPIVINQGKSLSRQNVAIDYHLIKGRGSFGYFKNIIKIKAKLSKYKPDLVHSHYSFSAFASFLAGAKPLVVSLMGSDVKSSFVMKWITWVFSRYFWECTIVKSHDMKKDLKISNAVVIPNGVDTQTFRPISIQGCRDLLGWSGDKLHILFAADPDRYVKNFYLAKEAIGLLDMPNLEVHFLNNINPDEVPIHFNASDVVLLTSRWEGSPNVIKEAMACNRPIVSTNVGDVSWLFGNTEGHFLSGFQPREVAEKIKLAIEFSKLNGSTRGLERIQELGLSSGQVAMKILSVYEKVLNK